MPEENRKIKVAVLGGGCGAMSAAFYLTSTPELRARYEVTVYQQGWRLGGKGAAGRDRQRGDRILEHGLHIWLGFYHNAFHLIQQCYAEWQPRAGRPPVKWEDVFQPQRRVTVMQKLEAGAAEPWVPRSFELPRLPGVPGQGPTEIQLVEMLAQLLDWIRKFLEGSALHEHATAAHASTNLPDWIEALSHFLVGPATREPGAEKPSAGHALLDHAHGLVHLLPFDPARQAPEQRQLLAWLLGEFQRWLQSDFIHDLAHADAELTFIWRVIDYCTANALGIVRDVLPWGWAGFDRINHLNYTDWLAASGAAPETVWSAPARVVYDLSFAYRGGVEDTPQSASMAAGVALGVCLRLALGYKDAPLWRMLRGMGDTIFAPIYEVLAKQRGVRFEFFHRVQNLQVSEDGTVITAIEIDRQARCKDGNTYEPLFEPRSGSPSWPSDPFWDQLENGEAMKEQGVNFESAWSNHFIEQRVLKNGDDFDVVVLGISVGSLPLICQPIIQRHPAWQQMLATTETVQTQAMQLWLRPDLAGLGWQGGSTIMTSYSEPFDSWGEMSELLPYENWPPNGPASLEYFCGVMPGPAQPPLDDPDYPRQQYLLVKQNAINWLRESTGPLWPKATTTQDPVGLNFNLLYDPENRQGEARFDYQYWRANIDPSERYVLSVPNSISQRLRAEDSGCSNLFLAGDWLVSSVNAGCVEAAVETGMAAARAICGVPKSIPNYPERQATG